MAGLLKDIETREDYEEYVERVRQFMEKEGLLNLSPNYEDGEEYEPYSSWRECECCHRQLGGDRYKCNGAVLAPKDHPLAHVEISPDYSICTDCLYFATYGKLDDDTMHKIGKELP